MFCLVEREGQNVILIVFFFFFRLVGGRWASVRSRALAVFRFALDG